MVQEELEVLDYSENLVVLPVLVARRVAGEEVAVDKSREEKPGVVIESTS